MALEVHANRDGALERMIRTFQDELFGYALRLLQNRFDAQEVTQDAFLRAHTALVTKYDEEKCRELALRPWLFRIVRNLSVNRHRSRRAAEKTKASMATEEPGVAYPVADTSECALLERALAVLDQESRDLVVLRFVEEMPYAEIASVTGRTEVSIRGKVFRALRRLRYVLEKLGYRHAMSQGSKTRG
jgi:RNA polymerase sigma-70 factor (ECF subfamily)